jgi:hypothetical protein
VGKVLFNEFLVGGVLLQGECECGVVFAILLIGVHFVFVEQTVHEGLEARKRGVVQAGAAYIVKQVVGEPSHV